MGIGEPVNRDPFWGVVVHPIQQLIAASFKRLHVDRFPIGHGIARDVNFDVLRSTSSCVQQQAMPGMESVKGTANQTSLEAEPLTHEPWSIHRPLSSSPQFRKKRPSTGLCPDT